MSFLTRDLERIVGADAVLPGDAAPYVTDATESRFLRGHADAVVLPATADEVARVVAWCYNHDVAIVPRGGGTGFAGGAVPVTGGVVVSLERLTRIRSFDPLLWRIHVEAGVRTAELRRLVRESGLFFPPDPGAAEQSQIGGNVATNAGGPHAFRYGVTGTWVMGLEAVVAEGEIVSFGGPVRKDVSGYDLKSLLIGSEGTLGIVTAAWLRLLPAPEAVLPVVACYANADAGCDAVERVVGSGLRVAALEYLDAGALDAAGAAFPAVLPPDAGFLVLAEADGTHLEAEALRTEVVEALGEKSLAIHEPHGIAVAELWRWRDGVSFAVRGKRGGKVSEDVVVPLERLRDVVAGTVELGRRHGVEACSWGHAGDGNVHSSFLVAPGDADGLARAEAAADELFSLAVSLGGSISGEHGIGWVKRGKLERQWSTKALELHAAVKRAWDPKGLFNPGKKT